jgi:DNA-binding IscR family transcriptional regulator
MVLPMELTEEEKKVVDALKSLKASEDNLKDADKIAKAAMMPKGKVANILQSLINKKIVRRVARGKAAGYYLISEV